MTEQPKQINRNYIDGLLDIAVTRLAILEASGAQYCLPGQVSRINKYLFRARHEVDGNLLLDAQFSLVKTMEHLEYTSELMFGLAEGSECLDHYALSTKDNQRDAVERYLASLNRLLNCDCDQITDDDILVENFYERLAIVGKALSTHDQLFVRIYASEHSDQVKEIISYFSNHGARREQTDVVYGRESTVEFSQDGLWFDVVANPSYKHHKLKHWDKDLRIQSVKPGGEHEP